MKQNTDNSAYATDNYTKKKKYLYEEVLSYFLKLYNNCICILDNMCLWQISALDFCQRLNNYVGKPLGTGLLFIISQIGWYKLHSHSTIFMEVTALFLLRFKVAKALEYEYSLHFF